MEEIDIGEIEEEPSRTDCGWCEGELRPSHVERVERDGKTIDKLIYDCLDCGKDYAGEEYTR